LIFFAVCLMSSIPSFKVGCTVYVTSLTDYLLVESV